MRLIDADEIRLPKGFFEKINNVPKFYEWLCNSPTVDAEPVKHGHWLQMMGHAYCSMCGYKGSPIITNYCPNCGAKMDEVEDESHKV